MNKHQRRELRTEIGMVFQGSALYDSMTVEENIAFPKNGVLAWTGTNKEIIQTDNEDVVDFVYSSELFKMVRDAIRHLGSSK